MKGLTFKLVKKDKTVLGWEKIHIVDMVIWSITENLSMWKKEIVNNYFLCCIVDESEYVEIPEEELLEEQMEGIYELLI